MSVTGTGFSSRLGAPGGPATARGPGARERRLDSHPSLDVVGRAAARRDLPDPAGAPARRGDPGHQPGRRRGVRARDRRAVRRRARARERGARRVRVVRDAAVRPGHKVAAGASADLGGDAVRDGAGRRRSGGMVGVAGRRQVGGRADSGAAGLCVAGDAAPRPVDHAARSSMVLSGAAGGVRGLARAARRRGPPGRLDRAGAGDRDDRWRQRQVGSARDHRGAGPIRGGADRRAGRGETLPHS